jgi:hypothetical protein
LRPQVSSPAPKPRFALPTGGGLGPGFQPTVQDYAEAGQIVSDVASDVAFGPERQSVFGGDASRPERTFRDWGLSEQEFRASDSAFDEGRPLAGLGWGALGLAGAVPFFGQAGRGLVRGVGAVGDVARGAGAAADVGRVVPESEIVSDIIDDIPEVFDSGLLRLDSSEGIRTELENYAALVENNGILTDQARFIDRLTGNVQVRTGTALDSPTPTVSTEDAQKILDIVAEESDKFPIVTRSDPFGENLWDGPAQRLWESEIARNEWPQSESFYDFFRDQKNLGNHLKHLSEAVEDRANLLATAFSDMNYYNIYGRVGSEISEDAAEAFARSVGIDFSHLPMARQFLDDSVIVINAPENALLKMASSNSFYNQFLTETSGGLLSPHTRVLQEWQKLNIPLSKGSEARPVYGYLAFPDLTASGLDSSVSRVFGSGSVANWARDTARILSNSTLGYGNTAFVLKPEYKNSSRFVFGDSLGNVVLPAPVTNPSTLEFFGSGLSSLPKTERFGPYYVEAQILAEGATISEMVDFVVLRNKSRVSFMQRLFPGVEVRVMEQ